MDDRVRKVSYCYLTVPNRAGQGARVLSELKEEGIDLLGYTGFPVKGRKAQLDLMAESLSPIRRLAKQHGWKMSKPKRGFLIQGSDQLGAVSRHTQKLADSGISITAADAVAAGKGRYGMMLWVKKKDFARAARVLKAK